VDASAHPVKRDNAGDSLPIAEGSADLVHEVVGLWIGGEWREPFDIREVARRHKMRWE
jgi:HD-like signal output (HDOD) protein